MALTSHYETLGVSRDATAKEISLAYKKLALSLHPDKNKFGTHLMKQVNEAKDVLLDETKRRRYDHELDHGRNSTRNTSSASASDSSLQQALRQSEHKRAMLKMEVSSLHAQLAVLRATQTPPRNTSHMNRLRRRLQDSEEKRRTLESQVTGLQSENNRLIYDLEEVEKENSENLWQKERYENEFSNAKHKLNGALKEERRKSKNRVAAALKEEQHKSKKEIERVRKSLTERSLCYRCNGEGGNDCVLCKGYGLLHGQWTKCLKCNGAGWHTDVSGKKEGCMSCFSQGAREGVHTVVCFKCKGNGLNCNVCYEGKIRGFNLKPCPFCIGPGCENCGERGWVFCQCGFSCTGHNPKS
ncbi:hypothetical protein ACHAWF_018614 [Thalassiosira exigua]